MIWTQKEIFAIPNKSLLQRRLTKAFFLKNFPLKASEKRALNNIILNMEWLASIKPSTANISTFIDDNYIYEEVQIFLIKIDEENFNRYKQILELIHKYIPYQIVIVLYSEQSLVYSVCDKRINKVDKSKRTIVSYTQTPIINQLYKRETETFFLESLHFRNLIKTNLKTTYQSYVKAIVQYSTSSITGKYTVRSEKRTSEDMLLLKQIEELQFEIVILQNQIKKSSSFSMKTKLNIDLQGKRSTIKELELKLSL